MCHKARIILLKWREGVIFSSGYVRNKAGELGANNSFKKP
jgi:hypothetical protein